MFGEPDYPEDIRLKYRFLDLRRETLHANIVKRTKVISSMRRRMNEAGFGEYSTPILTASSPEGARDFLVPSRIHQGKFFALPQAPQQYKQLLMVAGFDRYFQIAPCFRDEDPRADRLPGEFYQLDLEMSFVTQEDVWDTMAPIIGGVFEEFAEGKPVTKEWPRIPYDEAIRTYGSDKPDLRNPIKMQKVSDHFAGSGFKVFAGAAGERSAERGLGDPGQGRRQPRLLRPHERLGAGRRASRVSPTSSGAPRTARWRAPGRLPRTSARSAPKRSASSLGWATAMPCSSSSAGRRRCTGSPARRG